MMNFKFKFLPVIMISMFSGAVLLPGCKTPRGSAAASWELDGSEEKAQTFIISTVYKNYPGLPIDQSEVIKFARGLMDQKEQHAESSDYVLGKVALDGRESLESYIVLEFGSSTNVIEATQGKVALRYLGPAPVQSDVN